VGEFKYRWRYTPAGTIYREELRVEVELEATATTPPGEEAWEASARFIESFSTWIEEL
jgi:hypothetical protein